ncbi:Hypothetical protein PBC10988_6190 [Planctomycetales bacterium 10988]|nr:Hypothetical protein PBC10988_6190 [Planctomycetales bacterium 10988]
MNNQSFRRQARQGLTLLELLVVLVILTALSTLLIPSLSWMGSQSQRIATQENLRRLQETIVNQYMVDMGELPRPRIDRTTGTDPRMDHPQMVYLFVNPDTHEDGDSSNDWSNAGTLLSGRRWQGPYVQHNGLEYFVTDDDTMEATGTNFTTRYGLGDETTRIGDPTVTDAWGQPIVIQEPDADDNGVIDDNERRHTRLVSAGRNGRIDTPADELMPVVTKDLDQRQDDQIVFLFRHDEFNDQFLEIQD